MLQCIGNLNFEISTSKKEFVKNALINCKTYQKRACSISKMMCLHFTLQCSLPLFPLKQLKIQIMHF